MDLLHLRSLLHSWMHELLEIHPILAGALLVAVSLYVLAMTLLGCLWIAFFTWAALTKQDMRRQKWL